MKYTEEELLPIVKDLTMLDEPLGKKVFEDRECARFFLSLATQRVVTIDTIEVSRPIDFSGRHCIVQDVYVKGGGAVYDIELQRDNRGAILGRLIYYGGATIVDSIKKGDPYSNVPDTFIVFAVENCKECGDSPIHREDIGEDKGNGKTLHIIYLNVAYIGDNELGYLMHDFRCKDPKDMHYPILRDRMLFLKTTDRGLKEMTGALQKLCQDARKEGRKEGRDEGRDENAVFTVRNMLSFGGFTMEQILVATKLPLSRVEAIKRGMGL